MKTIVITGGSEGLGKEIAKNLSSDFNVYILARTSENLEKISGEIGCKYKKCDVTNYQEIESVFSEIIDEAGSIDVLVNNAGIWIEGPIDENDPEHIKQTIDVNTTGVINCTRAVVPHMKKEKSGTIIQINSDAGLYAKPERSVYNASKWAITGFTKALNTELKEFGIRVTGIHPGKLNTELFAKQGVQKDIESALDPEQVAKTVAFILSLNDDTVVPEIGILRMPY